MKNVLMIAYGFPPIGGSGVQRTVKFAKYLPLYGWNPIILTVKKDANNIAYADTSFLNELSNKAKIYRAQLIEPYNIYRFFGGRQKQGLRDTRTLVVNKNPSSFTGKIKNLLASLLVPDSKIGWYPAAIRKAREVFDNHDIKLVYSTSPKLTAHMIARHLSRKYGKPWVADFRDPWFADYACPLKRPTFLRRIDKYLESSVLFEATKITAATPGILEDIIRKHRGFDENKAIIITNGYDEEDFIGVLPKKFKHFTISYAGIFYKDSYPEPLFRGLTLVFKEEPKLRKHIKLLFIGISDPILLRLIEQYGLSDIIEHIPYVPHRECISYLLGSHLLFLNTIGNALTGKLFDYLGSGRRILALVTESTGIADIINRTKTGVVIDPDNSEQLKKFILDRYEAYKEKRVEQDSRQQVLIQQYRRKKLTRRLSQVFDEIT